MKYLCLICAEKVMEQLTEADARNHFQEYLEFTQDIKRNGHFVSANRLKPATTDGPFAETKEQLGGYYLIEARDMHEAIQVAAKIPGAKRGCVELRAIADDPQTLALGL
jgi:hypothetical protein